MNAFKHTARQINRFHRNLYLATVLTTLSAIPANSAWSQVELDKVSPSSLQTPPQVTTTISISGMGSGSSAAQAITSAENKLKDIEAKAKHTAKGEFNRQNHSTSVSNASAYPFNGSTENQVWQYNFSANYSVTRAEDGPILADEFAKSGISVSLSKDIQGQ